MIGQRILILGCSGSGKSTLTRLICDKYNLPPIHLDTHFWNPNWVETPKTEWRLKVEELCKADFWVMDGTFSESFDLRFPLADKVIVVNLPRFICLYRAIKRVFMYDKKTRRPDMADGCDETFDLEFYKYIWRYNKNVLPKISEAIEKFDCQDKTIYLTSSRDVQAFLRSLN